MAQPLADIVLKEQAVREQSREVLAMHSSFRTRSVARLAPLALFVAAVATTGCSGSSSEPDSALVSSSLARDTSPNVSAADQAALQQGNAAFAFDLYHTTAKTHASDNLFFSPHSISLALAMTYAGARNNTAHEMASTLHFTLPDTELHPAFDALDLALSSRGQGASGADGKAFRLHVANSLWGDRTTKFQSPFLDTLAVNYGAGMRVTDFIHSTEDARQAINHWTSDETEGRISDLLPQGSLTADTRLVLVNAIYFNAAWDQPFEPESTTAQPFTRLDGTNENVDTMFASNDIPYAEGEGYQAVELRYSGNDTSMIVVLPSEGAWSSFEPAISAASYDAIVGGLKSATVNLSLPKFKIAGASISLRDDLTALGMHDAFTDAADFSGIVDPTLDHLRVTDVLHKAFINVDEKGTEAAAATAVVAGDLSAHEDTKTFTVNRPFFVFIRDVQTGALLFFGRVTDPGQ